MTKPNIHELAKNGDTNAIAHLLNLMLPNGITAKVFLERDCLYVALTSSKVAVRQKWARFIFREIIRLDIEFVKRLEVNTQQGKNPKQIWRHQFKLKDDVKVYPTTASKLQTTNHQTANKNQSQDTMLSATDFQATLEECNKVSQQAYHKAKSYASQTETLLKELNYTLTTNASKIVNDKHAIKHEYARVLNEILVEVKNLFQAGLDELLKSLDTKKEHLQYFTIALFGRTKAGKSTLCETLTCGNGDSIGKGSQRTTKDVREYRWQGLRLLDTPGIEAYLGEEDADKANEIIDQSDMILFLVSDESIQPGEFEAMARLQRHNKYFVVILNIKDNIERPERLKRFIARPEKVFDEQRLSEHQNHIRAYARTNLQRDSINIVCIHAMAAFLSTKPEFKEESNNLEHQITVLGGNVASLVDGYHSEEEINLEIQKTEQGINSISQNTLEKIQLDLENEIARLQQKLEELQNSPLGRSLAHDFQIPSVDGIKIDNQNIDDKSEFSQFLGQGSRIFQNVSRFASGASRNVVYKVGKSIGYKFKPFEAFKAAKFIRGLAPILAGLGLALEIFTNVQQDQEQAEHEKKLHQYRVEIRNTYQKIANEIKDEYEGNIEKIIIQDFYEQELWQINLDHSQVSNTEELRVETINKINSKLQEINHEITLLTK